jgi:hypothetical protein
MRTAFIQPAVGDLPVVDYRKVLISNLSHVYRDSKGYVQIPRIIDEMESEMALRELAPDGPIVGEWGFLPSMYRG